MNQAEREALMQSLLVIEREACSTMSDAALARRLGNLSENADPEIVEIVRAEIARRGLADTIEKRSRAACVERLRARCLRQREGNVT